MFLPVAFSKDVHHALCRTLKRKSKKISKILAALLQAAMLTTNIFTNDTSRCILKLLNRIIGITGLTGVLIVSSSRLSVILGLLFCFNLVYSLGEFSNSPYV